MGESNSSVIRLSNSAFTFGLLSLVAIFVFVVVQRFFYPISHFPTASDVSMPRYGVIGFGLSLFGVLALLAHRPAIARIFGFLIMLGSLFCLFISDTSEPASTDVDWIEVVADFLGSSNEFPSYVRIISFFVAGLSLVVLSRGKGARQLGLPAFCSVSLFLLGLLVTAGFFVSPEIHVNIFSLPGSVGFIVLGTVLFTISCRDISLGTVAKSTWLPVSLGVAVLMFTVALWRVLIFEDHQSLYKKIGMELDEAVSEIERRMDLRVEAMERFSKHWARWGRPDQRVWETDATEYVAGHQGYQSIGWVDSSFHLRWIVPRAGNERTINLNMAFEKRRREALDKAKRDHHTEITAPLNLVEGGKGFRVVVPIYTSEKLDGFVVSAFKYERFFDLILHPHIARGYLLSIADGQETIYQRHLPSADNLGRKWKQQRLASGYGGRWMINIWPTNAKVAEETSQLPEGILIIGALVALLTALAVHLLQVAWRRKEEALMAKQLELQLRERHASERRLLALLEAAPDAILIFNRDNIIVTVNSQAENLLGRSRRELLGKPVELFLTQRKQFDKSSGDLGPVGRILTTHPETYLQRSDGTCFPAQVNCSFVELDTEHLGIAAIRNVTERKRQEEELARSNQELEHFAYVASHDLQEPLRMIISYLELLSRRYSHKMGIEADEFIGFAIDGAHRMRHLIEDLLSLSRVSRQRGSQQQDVSLEGALNQALLNLRASIQESGAIITHGPLPTVRGDAVQFSQLFQNLISNAIKYRKDENPRIHLTAEQRNSSWVVAVRDNGIGFDMKYVDRIFVIFQRLHTRQEYSGTGVGLAICKKIAERHGGKIWAESEPGLGSTFYISVPIEAGAMAS